MAKKILALVLILAFCSAALAGCARAQEEEPADDTVYDERENPTIVVPTGEPLTDMLSVRHVETGHIISLFDSIEDVTAFTGTDERDATEYTEENILHTGYWDMPGVYLNYYDEKTVVAIRLMLESGWEGWRGVYFGMPRDEAVALFADDPNYSTGLHGGILLSYDQDLNPIAFNDTAPYVFRVSFDENDLVEFILIDYDFTLLADGGAAPAAGEENTEPGSEQDDSGDADLAVA